MKRLCAILTLLILATMAAFAQTDAHTVTINVIDFAVIALNDTSNITFNTSAPALPGNDPGPAPGTPATDTSKRLWYTAVATTTKRITVNCGATTPPAGTTLAVIASSVEAGAGTASVQRTISGVAQDLVTAIPSVATGRTGTDGAALTYSFWVSTPGSLVAGAAAVVTVTYTITDT
jgi:hypothetical protein